jgi:serine protease AprX
MSRRIGRRPQLVAARWSAFALQASARQLIVASLVGFCALAAAVRGSGLEKLDASLRSRSGSPDGHSRVIVRTVDGRRADGLLAAAGALPGPWLPAAGGHVALVPNSALAALASHPSVSRIDLDRPIGATLDRTAATVGADRVADELGFDGSGVGVAIIDSGVTRWHDDLASRVVHFADFVTHQPLPYDDYGHGTHVAGIIAGNGHDSNGARRGMAPGAHLVALKVLDGAGSGYISQVIEAIDYAIQHREEFNIRVINVSVAAGVFESYNSDPLTLAARRAVEAGIVVTAAAGNLGQNEQGATQYAGITAPGNAPWVLTVGASSHMGTPDRGDDIVAAFSSRGPSYLDLVAKPDLVAPGLAIESLADPGSYLFATRPSARIWGTVETASEPYMSLSGTSMAAPVVAGTVALMLQANPALTPNAVKAILQYTAETRDGYNHLTQGAGFLNARGAVEFALTWLGGSDDEPSAVEDEIDAAAWNGHIIWGNRRIGGGIFTAPTSAWRTDVAWGATTTPEGERIAWVAACQMPGSGCADTNRPVRCSDEACAQPTARTPPENVVWGTSCGGDDCHDGTREGGSRPADVVWASSCEGPDSGPCAPPAWSGSVLPAPVPWQLRPQPRRSQRNRGQ